MIMMTTALDGETIMLTGQVLTHNIVLSKSVIALFYLLTSSSDKSNVANFVYFCHKAMLHYVIKHL